MRIKFILLILQCVISCYLSHSRFLPKAQPNDSCCSSDPVTQIVSQSEPPKSSGCSLKDVSQQGRPSIALELEDLSQTLEYAQYDRLTQAISQKKPPKPSGCSLKDVSQQERPSVKLELEDLLQTLEHAEGDRIG